jgi:hypothetical protein
LIWVLGVLCALALVALFFPFLFWVDFDAGMEGVNVRVRLFKKVLYTYKKKFGKESEDEEDVFDVSSPEPEPVEKSKAPEPCETEPYESIPKDIKPVEDTAEEDRPETPAPVETKSAEAKPEQASPAEEKPVESKTETVRSADEKSDEDKAEEKDPPEKRSLTDKEFWTLLLTPEFDTRAFWAVRHELSAIFKLFRVRFVDCFVEGFRMEYDNMGYAAALNGFLKSYPYIGDWDFRMDWTRDHEVRAEGRLRASVNLCRTLGLLLATLFYGGILAFTFWRRRAHILKTGELPELGFVRNKIVNIMTEDD